MCYLVVLTASWLAWTKGTGDIPRYNAAFYTEPEADTWVRSQMKSTPGVSYTVIQANFKATGIYEAVVPVITKVYP